MRGVSLKPKSIDLCDDCSMLPQGSLKRADCKALCVLIADDDETNRVVLESMLRRDGHEVYLAKHGEEAVSLYEAVRPDLVLMDIMMPLVDGYEATRRIKTITGNHFIHVIFLTALTDEPSLVKCLEVGGDDFIVKPVSGAILRAKLAAVARIHGLYGELERQQRDLSIHHERLSYEHGVAERIFAKVIGSARSEAANIRSEILPLAITNGDLLLAAQTPSGGQHVLLGDYTGHGLSAAIGAIPITDIFYAMTRKGFGIREIVAEMNRKLHATLPTGQFLAASLVEWLPRRGIAKIWNGGLPNVIVTADKERRVACIPSRNLPLGIVGDEEFKIEIDVRQISRRDRLYLYSDGLIDARDKEGRMFGQERLEKIVHGNVDRDRLFDEICEEAAIFRGSQPQDDDITIVEVLCDESLLVVDGLSAERHGRRPDYEFSVRLSAQILRNFDPLGMINGLINGIAALERHRSYLYTIIVELYANALEHGVLEMDCSLKKTPEGFARYYAERERLLAELAEGWIHVDIECFGDESSGELILQIEDSGEGFDVGAVSNEIRADTGIRIGGRGMELARSLCKSLSYDARGSYVRAVYSW